MRSRFAPSVIAPPKTVAPSVVVKPAGKDDDGHIHNLFSALHALNGEIEPRFALAPDWTWVLNEHLEHERTAGRGMTLLAWRESRPLGLLMIGGHADSPLFRDRHWAEILALYVVPEARGHGVAEELLRTGLAWAITHGFDHARLYVTTANDRARRFYARVGFRPMQEVWCLDLVGAHGDPDDDDACELNYAARHRLITPSPHIGGDESCPPITGAAPPPLEGGP